MLLEQCEETIQRYALIPPGTLVFVAISGGADSVALCLCLHQANYRIHLLHMNFQLRGNESNQDENWVRAFAHQLQLPCTMKQVDAKGYAQSSGQSIEAAARELRYTWFDDVITEYTQANPNEPAPVIATAHHRQDQAETMLHHLLRGSGLRGLGGIPIRNGAIIRPFLHCSRGDIESFLTRQQQTWRTDASNQDTQFTRNFLRHNVVPLLISRFPRAIEQLAETASILKETQQLLDQLVAEKAKGWWQTLPHGEQGYPVSRLLPLQPQQAWLWELFRPFGLTPTQLPDLTQLLHAQTGKYIRTSSHRILRHRNWLLVLPLASTPQSAKLIESFPAELDTASFQLNGKIIQPSNAEPLPTDPNLVWLDADAIELPIIIRPAKTSDYFYPLGLNKKKKISRFLTDLKLSRAAKENVWVLESGHRIMWVCGWRIDHRARVQPHTKRILQLQLTPTK